MPNHALVMRNHTEKERRKCLIFIFNATEIPPKASQSTGRGHWNAEGHN